MADMSTTTAGLIQSFMPSWMTSGTAVLIMVIIGIVFKYRVEFLAVAQNVLNIIPKRKSKKKTINSTIDMLEKKYGKKKVRKILAKRFG
jgi:uncharacterized membrane protein YqiK